MKTSILAQTEQCRALHLGLWLAESRWLAQAIAIIQAQPEAARGHSAGEDGEYTITDGGTAIFSIRGPMMKGDSKFATTTNTVRIRRQLREAMADKHVVRGLLAIDSPGGTVAGTADLASDVAAFRAKKPITAHIDDLGASAAYWVASQASTITANRTAQIGSVGVVAVIEDTSKAADMSGVKVHVIASGPAKAPIVDGAPIADEAIEEVRARVMELHRHFVSDVRQGRGWSADHAEKMADGRLHMADTAKSLGFIDAIESLDEHLNRIEATPRRDRADRILTLDALRGRSI